ncbi:TPA: DUF1553 domain-containing protein [Candidatus Poribacteria bacterium]|nr:DUF1553 domain-containing protein [Candidatus Poribacteria bacterium]
MRVSRPQKAILWTVFLLMSWVVAPMIGAENAYWAYQPVTIPDIPSIKDQEWAKNPIDTFILNQLEKNGLFPAIPATKQALIRRVYYDLTGLPPSPEEVVSFVNDTDPMAYSKLLDRLLASEQYGIKWGRHWLDLVRYAETNGYERDGNKAYAWRYRDYVIDAFNKDKPYDQFIREQLAGDLLDQVTPETIVATGFYRLGIWDDEPADRLLARYDYLDDIVSTTGQVMLGMSMGCVRCHDHKADPISIKDYYSFLAFFNDITPHSNNPLVDIGTPAQKQEHQIKVDHKKLAEEKLQDQIFKLEEELKATLLEPTNQTPDHSDTDLVDLTYRFYRDTWDQLPDDFDQLREETEGQIVSNRFTLRPASRNKSIGLVFEGKLRVPADDDYTFHINSIGGSRLWINGQKVTELVKAKGGYHQGTVALMAGYQPIRLEYFNQNADFPSLQVYWSLSGERGQRRHLSDATTILSNSRSTGQPWSYTFEPPTEDWIKLNFDDSEWETGIGGFGTHGTPGAVVRTVWSTPQIWLRKTFELDHIPTRVGLNLHHDEDVQVFINGTRVTNRRGYLTSYRTVDLKKSALKIGQNVIAVNCIQTGGGQYIDVGIVANPVVTDIDELLKQHTDQIEASPDLQVQVEQHQKLKKERDDSRKKKIPYSYMALAVQDVGTSQVHILERGNPRLQGDPVEPSFPTVLRHSASHLKLPLEEDQSKTKRRVVAEWIANPENPMTARVMVNRIWQHHFSRGIVRSSNDFGKFGTQATHSKLLDWLAHEFVSNQWRIKSLHKTIMMSNTYQMSAQVNEEALVVDPLNDLFWRFDIRRLTAEEIRDSVLSVSGNLNEKLGGPSVFPELPEEVLATSSQPTRVWGKSPLEEANRRSVYVKVKRSLLVPILNQFDMANTDSTCAVRFMTMVPTQSLTMLNGKFINQQAVAFAERIRQQGGSDLTDQIQFGLRLVLSRQPSIEEMAWATEFVETLAKKEQVDKKVALDRFALLALNLNEFIFLD